MNHATHHDPSTMPPPTRGLAVKGRETRTEQRRIPLTPAELERWREAAWRARLPLTAFVRAAVERAIDEQGERAVAGASSPVAALDELLERVSG